MEIDCLDPAVILAVRRDKATQLTRDAQIRRDPLGYNAAADLWEQIGETAAAEKCRTLAQLILYSETANPKPIHPTI